MSFIIDYMKYLTCELILTTSQLLKQNPIPELEVSKHESLNDSETPLRFF